MKYYKHNGVLIKSTAELPRLEEITSEQYEASKPQTEDNDTETHEKIRAIFVEIKSLKDELAETDYQALKYAEGWFSEEEYAPIKAKRQTIRDKINELQTKLWSLA